MSGTPIRSLRLSVRENSVISEGAGSQVVTASDRGPDRGLHLCPARDNLGVAVAQNPIPQGSQQCVSTAILLEVGSRGVKLRTVSFDDEAVANHEVHSAYAPKTHLLTQLDAHCEQVKPQLRLTPALALAACSLQRSPFGGGHPADSAPPFSGSDQSQPERRLHNRKRDKRRMLPRHVDEARHRIDKAACAASRNPCPSCDRTRPFSESRGGIVGRAQRSRMLVDGDVQFAVLRCPEPVRVRCRESGQLPSDTHRPDLLRCELWAAVVTLPRTNHLPASHRTSEGMRRVTIAKKLMGGRDSAASPDVVVDRVHAPRLRLGRLCWSGGG